MERWEWHEMETLKLGGYPITIAHCRAGKFVAFVGSGTCETEEDTRRAAREYRAKLDKRVGIEEDSSSG